MHILPMCFVSFFQYNCRQLAILKSITAISNIGTIMEYLLTVVIDSTIRSSGTLTTLATTSSADDPATAGSSRFIWNRVEGDAGHSDEEEWITRRLDALEWTSETPPHAALPYFLTSLLPHFLTSLLPYFLTSLLPHFLTSSLHFFHFLQALHVKFFKNGVFRFTALA
jgi:hypothetical protein